MPNNWWQSCAAYAWCLASQPNLFRKNDSNGHLPTDSMIKPASASKKINQMTSTPKRTGHGSFRKNSKTCFFDCIMNSAMGDNRSIVEQRQFDVAINRANCRNSERASCKAYRYPASNFAGSYMSNLTNSGTIARNMVLKTPECEGG